MNKRNINILGIKIDNFKKEEIYNIFLDFLNKEKANLITTINAEIILKAQKDEEYFYILNSASLSVLDGFGPKIAGFFMGYNIFRITGVDLNLMLLKIAQEKNIKLAILNKKNGLSTNNEIEKYLRENYQNLNYQIFNSADSNLIKNINIFKPAILIANLGAPDQEKFLFHNLNNVLSLKIAIGVGGSFDFLLGKIKRAPLIFRKLGLESFWRLINIFKFSKEKRKERLKRISKALFVFPYKFFVWRFILPFLYRPNVACLLYKKENDKIKILVVERSSEKNHWQIPQGGLDNLSAEEAGMKELREELNNNNFKFKAVFRNIHKYKFDLGVIRNRGGFYLKHMGYKGQKQDLMIAEFYGQDKDISVNFWDHRSWKWVNLEDIESIIHKSRKEAMGKFINLFKEYISKI